MLETYYRGKLVSPVYTFVEFPKWVKDSLGKEHLVQTAEEEAQVLTVKEIKETKRGRPKNDSTAANNTL
jgi:hypothetical protein